LLAFLLVPIIGGQSKVRRITMKSIVSMIVALGLAVAFTAPAFAGILDAKNKAECEKAGGVWVEKDNKCGAKKQ
jgi:hypothetical protein